METIKILRYLKTVRRMIDDIESHSINKDVWQIRNLLGEYYDKSVA